eukprot:TRINITY_DN6960_c0_g2_i1.p1 TRINITY_DN6960_c0_g2~~TRINITY_DN6960_c0_g2_i1.p1  ORF type:complete len:338 (-),score=70.79 TRINITY_DN6960_c0_g2_i1:161-1174(-)
MPAPEQHGAGAAPPGVMIVSSPMRRCLQTIRALAQQLKLPREACVCHGSAYEYRQAGAEYRGSTTEEIQQDFPEFRCVGFGSDGHWDYRGTSEKETEPEFRQRASELVRYLKESVLPSLQAKQVGSEGRTVVLVLHQSIGDLVCQHFLAGTDAAWEYGAPQYRLQEAGITELILNTSGQWKLGLQNDGTHLLHAAIGMRAPAKEAAALSNTIASGLGDRSGAGTASTPSIQITRAMPLQGHAGLAASRRRNQSAADLAHDFAPKSMGVAGDACDVVALATKDDSPSGRGKRHGIQKLGPMVRNEARMLLDQAMVGAGMCKSSSGLWAKCTTSQSGVA